MIPRIVGSGYHDVHFRWDLSVPERVVGRLASLPHAGPWPNPGRSIWMERDRFGKAQHLLGDRHVLIGWAGDAPPPTGEWKRLEVQSHLGPEGEDDLLPVVEFGYAWLAFQQRLAVFGVLPVTEPRVTRIDVAVDVVYENPDDGHTVLEGLRFARWPNGWYAEWVGKPPYTTVNVKSESKTVGRVYCRNTKLRNGGPRWGKLRFEREQTFPWALGQRVELLESAEFAGMMWESVFGAGQPSGKVTRIAREVQTVKLIDRVRLGELTYSQFERMTAYLDAERLGLASAVYTPAQLRERRREAKRLGLSESDTEYPEFDAALDDLLAVPRSAWAA